MDNHRVVDVGGHDALLGKCQKYQDLIKRQSVMIRNVSQSGIKNMLPGLLDGDSDADN